MTSYYHYDGQLSTRQLSDSNSQVTDTYVYDAFGLLLNRSGATENNYLYTGEQYDANVGFYYLRARYYNASIGRFLTQDTFPGMQFEPASLHRYLYCEGNPVNNLDPSGEIPSTLVELTMTLVPRLILCSVVLTTISSFLNIIMEPAIWTGNMGVVTLSAGTLNWGFGFVIASLSGVHESEDGIDTGYGLYLIFISGITLAGYPQNISWTWLTKVVSPGLFRAAPTALVGPVTYISSSWTIPAWASKVLGNYGIGAGFAYTYYLMGFGISDTGILPGVIIGKDRGIDFMGGLSFLLSWRY